MNQATILAVDDHPESLALMVRVLTGGGYQVRAADSGDLALASAETGPPDLVILDVNMVGIDGFEVCRRLKALPRTRDVPVILVSAFSEGRDWARGLQLGAADYLSKPFDPEELLTRVKTHLSMSWANRILVEQAESLRAEIVHRERVETELREREVQYHNLADSGLALIWTSGTDKLVHYFNEPWLKFTGRTLEQELGDGWIEGVHTEDRDRCLTTYTEAFDQREPFEMEYRLKHASGDYRWIVDMGTPNYDSQGRFVGYIGHCFDITEKLKYLEALQRSDKLESLGILAGGIAHDFNNLLAGLFAYVSLARERTEDAQIGRYLDKALTAFGRAKDLTRQMLTFAKGGSPVLQTGDLAPLLRQSAEFSLSGLATRCEYRIEALCPVEFDANQLGQVIDNLVINAQQAMKGGGRIVLSARNTVLKDGDHPRLAPGVYVEVTVADEGPGIPAAILPRIFDPFFTTKPEGNGLGLPTCHSILQRHGGAIDVETEAGVGTVFRILLPASNRCVEAEASEGPGAHRGQGTVLVLDDEEMIRELASEWLTGLGYGVVTVKNGDEAVTAVSCGAPPGGWAAALLDLTVPGGRGGREAVSAIRECCPTLPVFATSGYSDDPVMANPERFGFTASLRKPYLKEELVELLNRFVEAK